MIIYAILILVIILLVTILFTGIYMINDALYHMYRIQEMLNNKEEDDGK